MLAIAGCARTNAWSCSGGKWACWSGLQIQHSGRGAGLVKGHKCSMLIRVPRLPSTGTWWKSWISPTCYVLGVVSSRRSNESSYGCDPYRYCMCVYPSYVDILGLNSFSITVWPKEAHTACRCTGRLWMRLLNASDSSGPRCGPWMINRSWWYNLWMTNDARWIPTGNLVTARMLND